MRILSIKFVLGADEDAEELDDENDRFSDRQIVVEVAGNHNDIQTVIIDPCHESYEQYGGASLNALKLTGAIARKFNPWLHGGELNAVHSQD